MAIAWWARELNVAVYFKKYFMYHFYMQEINDAAELQLLHL